MKTASAYAVGALLLVAALACSLTPGTPTPLPPTDTPAPTGPCEVTAGAGINAYTRPSLSADVFGPMPAGTPIQVGGRTADGWLGFDPGVAQAANIGVFRLRWVQESEVTLSGDCAGVPVVVGPTAGVCYTMPMEDVPVYQSPDTTSTVLVTLHVEDYAAVTGVMGTDWALVDLSQGNTGQTGTGWIASTSLNLNGPCDALPEVAP